MFDPDPYPKPCPQCGHKFTLAGLKEMAVGDGYQRLLPVLNERGEPVVIGFDDFNPATMQVADTDAWAVVDGIGPRLAGTPPMDEKDLATFNALLTLGLMPSEGIALMRLGLAEKLLVE